MEALTKPESHTSFLLCFLLSFSSIIHQTIMPHHPPSTLELTQILLNSLLFVFFLEPCPVFLSRLHLISSSSAAMVTCLDITCAARSPMRPHLMLLPSALHLHWLPTAQCPSSQITARGTCLALSALHLVGSLSCHLPFSTNGSASGSPSPPFRAPCNQASSLCHPIFCLIL